eukprot:gene14173-21648_t
MPPRLRSKEAERRFRQTPAQGPPRRRPRAGDDRISSQKDRDAALRMPPEAGALRRGWRSVAAWCATAALGAVLFDQWWKRHRQ